ncbi:MAG: inositol monophosphatase family protein [Litorimonas sp.]
MQVNKLHNPAQDLELLRDIVRQAGNIAATAYHAGDAKSWDKQDNSPVTDADIAVNDFLAKTLQAARPNYGWLSEETKDDDSRHERRRSFVVDPIDGTRSFIDRTQNFTICVAVIEDGEPIAGAVFNPLKDEFYEASIDGGARLNNAPIKTSMCDKIDGCTMVGYPRKFRRLDFPDMNCRIVNSMAYRMVLVASGQAHATLAFTPKSDWDLAAATLIAREAGALVTDIRGDIPRFNGATTTKLGVICASPRLQALLLEKVEPHLATFDKSLNKAQDFKHLGTTMSDREASDIQLLHLVIGGELVDPSKTEFKDLTSVDYIGAYGCFEDAHMAWKGAAQRSVDNAHMRYFILHAHELIDPDKDGVIG